MNEVTILDRIYKTKNRFTIITDLTDNFLLHYIIGTKMRLEIAKEKLDLRFTLKERIPELFAGRNPHEPNFVKVHKMV